jgi:hypothetical protein
MTKELHAWLLTTEGFVANANEEAVSQSGWCTRSHFVKPPRAHFDNVSQRLVLCMDHFCPWVGNTIGFFNRKFFLLLLLYTSISAGFLVITSVGTYADCSSFMAAVLCLDAVIAGKLSSL